MSSRNWVRMDLTLTVWQVSLKTLCAQCMPRPAHQRQSRNLDGSSSSVKTLKLKNCHQHLGHLNLTFSEHISYLWSVKVTMIHSRKYHRFLRMVGKDHQMGHSLQRNAWNFLHLRQWLNLWSVGVMANARVSVPAEIMTCHVQHYVNAVTVRTLWITEWHMKKIFSRNLVSRGIASTKHS